MMEKCRSCVFAEWDYETFYGTSARQCFVSGCKNDAARAETNSDGEVVGCTAYEEVKGG